MAKKRKASSKQDGEPKGPNFDVGASRKRIRDFEDVADSDDEFHITRDKILLDDEPDVKRRRKEQEQEEFLQPSDEEVLDYDEEDEEDIEDGDAQQYGLNDFDSVDDGEQDDAEDEDERLQWGTSREDMYGADDIETEEQAIAEVAEASRLQRRQFDRGTTGYDFSYETEWQDGGDTASKTVGRKDIDTEDSMEQQIREDMDPAERLKYFKNRYLEFELFSKQLLHMRGVHPTLVEATKPKSPHITQSDLPNAMTKLRAGTAYLGALTMYFALLASTAASGKADAVAMPIDQLRDHPVMEQAVQCRELWMRAQDLPSDPEPSIKDGSIDPTERNGTAVALPAVTEKQITHVQSLKKSRAQRHAEALHAADEARKAERMKRTEADLANLDSLIAPTMKHRSKQHRSSARAGDDSDVGEESALTAHEAAEKAKRKKSLRFYTSQIAQKANKRGTAGRNAGGDDDIPYRERLKDRQARLNAEAEKRGRKDVSAGAELGGESDEEDLRQAQDIRAGGADNDYYNQVAARTAKKKADKGALAEAQKQAALQGGQVIQQETVGVDGKRKITYAIEKNKGLTPHRKKEVRNPRVKKRKKYDEKKKKLASIKPVYKGGEGRGGYGGELTGIKTGLIKSTRL